MTDLHCDTIISSYSISVIQPGNYVLSKQFLYIYLYHFPIIHTFFIICLNVLSTFAFALVLFFTHMLCYLSYLLVFNTYLLKLPYYIHIIPNIVMTSSYSLLCETNMPLFFNWLIILLLSDAKIIYITVYLGTG